MSNAPREAIINRDSDSSKSSDMKPRDAITEKEGRILTEEETANATTDEFLENRALLLAEGNTPEKRKKTIHDNRILRLLESSEAIRPEDIEKLTTPESLAFTNYRQLQEKIQKIETTIIPILITEIQSEEEILNDDTVDPSQKEDARERFLVKTNSLLQTNRNLEREKSRLERFKNEILNKFVRCVEEKGSGGGCSLSGGRRRKSRTLVKHSKKSKKHFKKHSKKSHKNKKSKKNYKKSKKY
jgi:hypothetical protein